ncbi:MAG: class A beta-lactamase-related serine hydrolase [Desulfobacterales bacterium]|nr:class A beta-lactamase-related serine hydrolase [Desulfobacterales bacterium]
MVSGILAGRILRLLLIFSLFFLFLDQAAARNDSGRFDVSYIWNSNLDSLLDYKEEVERVLGPTVGARLRVVGRNGLYGLIYDRDGDASSSAWVARRHTQLLVRFGLEPAVKIKDDGYFDLFNVCYGLGPNLGALKAEYGVIYRYLGQEVGKNLFIEKTGSGNYTLIYRRRGDRRSTATVARRHARLLARKKIRASITRENNNEVVFGESSLLDSEEDGETSGPPPAVVKKGGPGSRLLLPGALKRHKSVAGSAATGNSALEAVLERYIKQLRRKGRIAGDESTGWLVYDLTSRTSLVDINVDRSFQAASMIKPFLALAFFHRVKEGRIKYGPRSRSKMAAMIQRSNNSATNWVMRQVGGPAAIQKLLTQHYGAIFTRTSIVEYIPAGGQTYRNRASLGDYLQFLAALWRGRLPYAKEIRRLMALPGRDRLYNGTVVPQGTLVYNKTGTTAHLCGDMGILAPRGKDGQRYPYAIVGIIEKKNRARNYGKWKMARGNVIRQVSSMVYRDMQQRYNLR